MEVRVKRVVGLASGPASQWTSQSVDQPMRGQAFFAFSFSGFATKLGKNYMKAYESNIFPYWGVETFSLQIQDLH